MAPATAELVCAAPITRGTNKGKPATGTEAGYQRHRHAGEPACDACAEARGRHSKAHYEANRDAVRERRRAYREANREKVLEQKRAYREANRDAILKRDRAWREANPEKTRETQRAWREANPEKVREKNRAYYEANRDAVLKKDRAWRAANPEKVRATSTRHRARKRDATIVPFTVEQERQRMSMFRGCWMCPGGGEREHVDHVKPLSKGGAHCLANLRPACANHNQVKSDTWPFPTRSARGALAVPPPGALP